MFSSKNHTPDLLIPYQLRSSLFRMFTSHMPITAIFSSTPIISISKPVVVQSPPMTPDDASIAGGGPGPASPSISSPPKIPPPPLSPLRNGRSGVVMTPPASPSRKASVPTVKKPSNNSGCDCCPTPYKKLGLPDQPPPPPPPPPVKPTDSPAVNPTVRPSWMT